MTKPIRRFVSEVLNGNMGGGQMPPAGGKNCPGRSSRLTRKGVALSENKVAKRVTINRKARAEARAFVIVQFVTAEFSGGRRGRGPGPGLRVRHVRAIRAARAIRARDLHAIPGRSGRDHHKRSWELNTSTTDTRCTDDRSADRRRGQDRPDTRRPVRRLLHRIAPRRWRFAPAQASAVPPAPVKEVRLFSTLFHPPLHWTRGGWARSDALHLLTLSGVHKLRSICESGCDVTVGYVTNARPFGRALCFALRYGLLYNPHTHRCGAIALCDGERNIVSRRNMMERHLRVDLIDSDLIRHKSCPENKEI